LGVNGNPSSRVTGVIAGLTSLQASDSKQAGVERKEKAPREAGLQRGGSGEPLRLDLLAQNSSQANQAGSQQTQSAGLRNRSGSNHRVAAAQGY
jgi:hypothetical protein